MEWVGTHKRMGYTSCKDDILAVCMKILFAFSIQESVEGGGGGGLCDG
jgi:hypothetical protein